MGRTLRVLFVSLAMAIIWAAPVCGDAVSVVVNGVKVSHTPPAIFESGQAYLEIKDLFSILGVNLTLDSESGLYNNPARDSVVVFNPFEGVLETNSGSYKLKHPMVFLEDNAYVPVSDFSEIYDFTLSYGDNAILIDGSLNPRSGLEYDTFPHYRIDALYSGGKVYGEEEVEYCNPGPAPLSTLFFALPAASVNPSARTIIYDAAVDGQSVVYDAAETGLEVYLPNLLQPGAKCSVNISFDTLVPEGTMRLAHQGETAVLSCWYPVIPVQRVAPEYSAFGEPYSFKAGTYDLRFSAAADMDVFSGISETGTMQEGNKETHFLKSNLPIRDATVVVGHFQTETARVGNVMLCYASQDPDPDTFETAEDSLKTFQEWWGEYPYPALTLVDVPIKNFHGMEYGGILLLSTINAADSLTVAHEVSHQWWYGLVGNNQEKEAWIDEGLATYSAVLYQEQKDGKSSYDAQVRSMEAAARGLRHPIGESLADYPNEAEYKVDAYIRGALFWHDVRQEVGKKELLIIMRGLQNEYRYGEITSADIFSCLRRSCPGKF